MSWIEAILLGVVQGLTEFLPVSSSGHLALTQMVMEQVGGTLPPSDAPAMLLYDVCAHLGTLVAVMVVFASAFSRYARGLWRELPQWRELASDKPPGALYVTALAAVACVPTGLIGLAFKDFFESAFARPTLIGVALLVTAALLVTSERRPRPKRGWRRFGYPAALLVGVAQGLAITPGISRSGSTVCVALICGLKRRWAAQFSFLIAFVPILGASVMKIADVIALGQLALVSWGPMLVGSAVAGLVGYGALRVFLAAIQRAKLRYFAAYCALVGLAAIVAGLAGWIGAG